MMGNKKPTPEQVKAQKDAITKKKLEKKGLKDLKDIPPVERPLPNYVDSKRFDTVEVKVDLAIHEKNAAGQELAHKKKQLDQIDIDRKSHMQQYKDRMDEIKAQISSLADKVTLGYEYRKFRCTLHFDFIRKVRIYNDADSGETRLERPLEADDYQMRLPV